MSFYFSELKNYDFAASVSRAVALLHGSVWAQGGVEAFAES